MNLIAYLAQLQDEFFLEKLERLILNNQSEFEPTFKPFSKEELISRIKRSEKDFEEGKVISQEELH